MLINPALDQYLSILSGCFLYLNEIGESRYQYQQDEDYMLKQALITEKNNLSPAQNQQLSEIFYQVFESLAIQRLYDLTPVLAAIFICH
ncbi:MAG: hypothetical protein HRU23_15740 [Gammaproteobacteria bacterium]|nr:hypothetical protein [Gammaproteobacteria bacterium]